jgi:hypothetical protein
MHEDSHYRCIIPECGTLMVAKSVYRGLCVRCYQDALSLVQRGHTTWDELEVMGLVEPHDSPFMQAFTNKLNGRSSVAPF